MNETIKHPQEKDHTRAVIIATTIVVLTCILSCATVLVILILRMS